MSLIEGLIKLYRVDQQLRGLRARLDGARRHLHAQTRQLEEVLQRREELSSRKRLTQAKVANLENEGAALDEQLEKFRRDMNTASTNKQYSAVLTEMNTVKVARAKLDDSILEQMGAVEELDRLIGELEVSVTERERMREVAAAQFRERELEVGARLAELEQERTVAAGAIPSADLQIFDEMADAYEGEAMAAVQPVNARRREYGCGACNLQMPFDQVSLLLSNARQLVRCPACGRILFLEEAVRTPFAKATR